MNFDSLFALNLIVVHLEEVFAMADAVSVFGKVGKIFIFTTVLRKLRMRKQHTNRAGRGARASYQTMFPEISAR